MGSLLSKLSGSTRRVTFGLSIIQLFKAFLSFFTVIISSAYFGTSLGRDVWLISLSIVSILGAIIFGPVFEIFRAKFVMIREGSGEREALEATGSLLAYILIISFIIILLSEIIPAILGKAFAPTYTSDQQEELKIMIRLIAPTLVFSVTVSVLTGLLNIYSVFYVPEIMNIFSSILNVVIILIFAPSIGIYSLVISGYLSNLILVWVLLIVMEKNNIRLLPSINLDFSHVLSFFRFALPFYFNYFIAQLLLAAEKIISTLLGIGSVSVLDYARKFVSIPIGVIQSTVNVVLTATLTKIHIREGERMFIIEMNKFMDMMILVTLPLIALFVVCPEEIVRVFLLRGAFDPSFVQPTSQALFWFGFGIVSIIFYSTNAQALVAKGKTTYSAFISGVLGFFILAINIIFYKKYGIQILAFSWSIGHLIAGTIMYFGTSRSESRLLLIEFLRKASIILITVITLILFYNLFIKFFFAYSVFDNILKIFIVGLLSILIELSLIFILRFKEKDIVYDIFNSYIITPFKLKFLK